MEKSTNAGPLNRASPPGPARKAWDRARGFTLVEVMITLVVVALLAAVALPSFLDSIRKSRRAEAFHALNAVQAAQERWRSNHPTYATDVQLDLAPGADPPGLGVPRNTAGGYYALAITASSATGYTVTAVPTTGSSQAHDGACAQLRIVVNRANMLYGSAAAGTATFNDSGSNRCWSR